MWLYLVATLVVVLIGYFKWSYQYWAKRGVPCVKPRIPLGNVLSFPLNEHMAIKIKKVYEQMKKQGYKHAGLYFGTNPQYLPIDLELYKHILVKDFDYFVDRVSYCNEKDDPLSGNLVMIGGTKWRNLRTKLTPTFTTGKIKMMFQVFLECQTNLVKRLDQEAKTKNPVDIRNLLTSFTMDVIGSCGFGLDFNSFEDDQSPFRVFGRKIFHITTMKLLKNGFAQGFPRLARFFGLMLIPQDITDFFVQTVKDTVKFREENSIRRKDFFQLLIDLKNDRAEEDDGYSNDGKSLTIEEIAAQSFGFFTAAFDSSSISITMALYEIAKNQIIQERLRDEIEAVLDKYEEKITYEGIMEMKYMEQVFKETLRRHPPIGVTQRLCIKDYRIPGTDTVIQKGTTVVISILGIHHDEEFYPNSKNFDPERFNEDNKASRDSFAYIPFGEGPRGCIGKRFGTITAKVALTSILKKYKISVNPKTEEPLTIQSSGFAMAPNDIWLDVQMIQ